MELWFREEHKGHLALELKVQRHLYSGRSEFQQIDILETAGLGRVLVLDGVLMTTERDEFVYHEMLTHVPLFTHPDPKQVLIVGGGDGGTARETLKHPSVQHVDLVEIDALVVEKSREFLPTIAGALDDPRVSVHCADGIRWVEESAGGYDAILVDSTDPVGLAEGLFSANFYAACRRALTDAGVLTAQTQSPFFDQDEVRAIHGNLRAAFPAVHLYTAAVPTYPGGLWTFALASNGPDPLQAPWADRPGPAGTSFRYYNQEVHRAAFALPSFLRDLLR